MVVLLVTGAMIVCRTLSLLFRNVAFITSRGDVSDRQFQADSEVDASPLRRIPRKVCWSNAGPEEWVPRLRRRKRPREPAGALPEARTSCSPGDQPPHRLCS